MITDKIFFDEKDPTGINYDTPFTVYGSFNGRLWSKTPEGTVKFYSHNEEVPKLTGGADANFTAMPQVSGVPIVATGSNSTGTWVRYADGTQITHQSGTLGATNSSTFGSASGLFRSNVTSSNGLSLPNTFIANPIFSAFVTSQGASANDGVMLASYRRELIDVDLGPRFMAISDNNSSNNSNYYVTAIGRWV